MLSLHTTPPLMFSSARLSSPRLGFLLRRQRRRRKRPRLPKPENPVPYHSYILFHHLRPSLRLSKLRLCHHVYDRRGWSLSTDGEICSCGSACSDLDSDGYRDRRGIRLQVSYDTAKLLDTFADGYSGANAGLAMGGDSLYVSNCPHSAIRLIAAHRFRWPTFRMVWSCTTPRVAKATQVG
jgi:hypothetical protein